ncbi:hypothetical protein [Falsiroseomonas sp. HW251]|uniref:hypothetical protein n=1 Tax=Falsiroseomonas sp. HW251 TaxID=3390998 RepID=UPI003D3232DA
MRRLAFLIPFLLLATPAEAQQRRQPVAQQPPAAPACAAQGPLREAICADPALRGAEARLRGLERALAAATSRPATTALFLAAFEPQRETLAGDLADRTEEIEARLAMDRAMRAIALDNKAIPRPQTLETRCLGAVLRNCRVTGAGVAISEDGRTRVLWQSQAGFTERDGNRAGIVLLGEARGGWRPIGWTFEGHEVSAPKLVEAEGVLLLHVAGRGGGSGATNTDLLYRRDRGTWAEVETETWRAAAEARLPAGFSIWQAVDYDMAQPVARARLAKPSDPNCCPTGGAANLVLRVDGTRLALADLLLDSTARAQRDVIESRATPDSCPAERATWRLDAPQDWTASLSAEWPGTGSASSLSLRLRSGATGRELWFVFAAAQGYGGTTILPVAAPGARTREDGLELLDIDDDLVMQLGFYAFDAELASLPDPPLAGRPAPPWLFMPRLGVALHYGGLPGVPEREAMPVALWKLAACRD